MNKSTPKIIAVFFAIICFFSAVQAQEPVPYIITGNVTDRFTATQSGSVVGEADTSIAYIIASIQGSCGSGTDCTIQFGNGTSVLDIGADSAYFGGTWGIINLTGKITSANNNSNFGTIHITLASVTDVAVNINADIENTGSAGRAVYLASTRAVNVTGGKIEAKGTGASRAIHSNSTAVLTISGSAEIISAGTGNAINQTSGTTNIIGGTISTIGSGNAFQQTSGTTNVNGGTISTIGNGNAIYQTNGTINVNGGTVSATGTGYAIYQTSVGTINVNGGTVSTASGYTIHNDANAGGTVSIKGGTVENKTANSYAIFNGSTGLVVLSGDPTVTGVIRAAFGKLSADATFAPGALK
ncbi:MAG: hypothetical protein FWC26_01905, partial [Fibromonadales bacterium]|nr:hypothetical protein [Fibromonadales bacterium]